MLKYRNLFVGINDALDLIFEEERYADKVISNLFYKNKKWGKRDRAFVAETIYDTIRWKRKIEFCMGESLNPANSWTFVGTWFSMKGEDLPDWEEFYRVDKPAKVKANLQEAHKVDAIRNSIPNWMQQLGEKELGKDIFNQEMEVLNQLASIVLRVNTLKITRDQLKSQMAQEGIVLNEVKSHPDALQLKIRANVFRTEAFKSGYFEVQDASSQKVAAFLDPKPGMRVIDACAGAGGKTLHLASLMENKGQIYALDIHEWKLKELKKRAKRNGAGNIQSKVIENAKTVKRLLGSADRVLLDVPCSGLGVLKRNPDSKWKLSPAFIDNMKKEQQEILQGYSKMLKPGGQLVYSTCSILPSENQEQIATFLAANLDFSLLKDEKILPSESGFDGFYMALLERKK